MACCLAVLTSHASAEGTAQLRSATGDPVLLLLGDAAFGDFASYDSPRTSRLNFYVAEAGETVYLGLGRLFRSNGVPERTGQYRFRIRRASDNETVYGPFVVNDRTENLTDYAQALAGPATVNPQRGYPVSESRTFVAPGEGEYYIEFERNFGRNARYIGLWDITIVNNGEVQPGRVYSRNWAFRVPEQEPEPPLCAFGAELSTRFFSYTTDGFVTMIDFTDSGFQPLSFNLAFNRTGPGTSGNLLEDRKSVHEANATDNSAEHLIFLNEPDPMVFPDGQCGEIQVSNELRCRANSTFCVPVAVTIPGQVEIVLDFNSNGRFDDDTDRLLAYSFVAGELEACVPWDGILPDGSRPAEGVTVDILVEYTQGVQHWACYDGELLRNGFCVTPVRPVCDAAGRTPLHYDDSNIPDDPGTGAPKRVLNGCDCATENCRTWTYFETFATDDCLVRNEDTEGYGDRNTLNTWWYASSRSMASFDVPLDAVAIDGPVDFCPTGGTELNLSYFSDNEIGSIRWTGPNGPLSAGNDRESLTVFEAGMYEVIVSDEFGCESTGGFTLLAVDCTFDLRVVEVACNDNGTKTDPNDDTFTARLRIDGDNSSGWVAGDGTTGAYGQTIELGPFRIADGPVSFEAADSEYDCCADRVEITPPAPCSDGCAITSAAIHDVTCLDNGTLTDPTDDQYTFEVRVSGINTGANWSAGNGAVGNYDEVVTLGPFDITDGNLRLTFTDSAKPECVFTTSVQPPRSCSDLCVLEPTYTTAICDDRGTPYDASDDTYTFQLSVAATNTASPAYLLDGNGPFLYGQTYAQGPFPIEGDDFTFTISDMGKPDGCNLDFNLDTPPVTCSDACGISIGDVIVTCDESGGGAYRIEVLVNNQNPNSQGWTAEGGNLSGEYGTYVDFGAITPNAANVAITVAEAENGECTANGIARSPQLIFSCPEDVEEITYPTTVFSFSGRLNSESGVGPSDREVCYLTDERVASGGARYFERLTLRIDDENVDGLVPFSFFLTGPADRAYLGAVFALADAEEIDCCDLVNEGPVSEFPRGRQSTPELPEGLLVAGDDIHQRFTLYLRPRQTYTLLTTSPRLNEAGPYRWTIVSPQNRLLTVARADARDPELKIETLGLSYPLGGAELAMIQNVAGSIERFGQPELDEDCGSADYTFSDQVTADCSQQRLSRRFDASVGDNRLELICVQDFRFVNPDTAYIAWPPAQITFGCTDSFPELPSGYPAPEYTGFPSIYRAGQNVRINENGPDNLSATYEDRASTRTDGGTDVFRRWTVVDECAGTTAVHTQLLKLEANGIPFFTCPITNHYCPIVEEDIMLWPSGRFDCSAEAVIPEPEINNVCNLEGWTFMTDILRITEAGDTVFYASITADDRTLTDLPIGDYLIRYTGTHEREEIEPGYCRFRIADTTEPVATCKSRLDVSLAGNGLLRLPYMLVNQGSYDNCGIERLRLRRRFPDREGWSDLQSFLTFDCTDVGYDLTVELWIEDGAGNENYCTSTVRVEDNTLPYCVNLPDRMVSCDALPNNFSAYDTTQLRALFGLPEVVDNCSAEAVELEPIVAGDNCSPERIVRRFRAIDQHGNFSSGIFEQKIEVIPSLNYALRFPRDVSTVCSDFVDTLRIVGAGCDSITFETVDINLPRIGDECRHVERSYIVTNWCEWDGRSDAIRINRDEDNDGREGNAEVWLLRNENGIFVADDDMPDDFLRRIENRPGGRYVYAQRLRVFDEVAPEVSLKMADSICIDTARCRAPLALELEVFDACQVAEGQLLVEVDLDDDGTVDISSAGGGLEGSFPSYTFTGELTLGEHRLIVTAVDDCDNRSRTEQLFTVFDCYVPELVCTDDRIFNLEALLEQTGDIDGDGIIEEAAVLVEAAELAQCNFPDCSGGLTYSVNRVGEPIDPERSTIYLDCEDRYQTDLEVYVWDGAFNPHAVQPDGSIGGPNWRFCIVRVRIQDPSMACTNCQVAGSVTINGRISGPDGNALSEVLVSAGAETAPTVSNRFGGYQFSGEAGQRFELSATKEDDPRAGIDVRDALLLRRYILGRYAVENPFFEVAADLNGDGKIDLNDLVVLQALVLGKQELYPVNVGWRFISAEWDGNGEPPATIELGEVNNCSFSHDFVGFRLGDLDFSYGEQASEGRPAGLAVDDMPFIAGNEYRVSLNIGRQELLEAGQALIGWDPTAVTLTDVSSTSINIDKAVRRTPTGLWLAWNANVDPGKELLELTFAARKGGRISDYLRLVEDQRLPARAYTGLDSKYRPLYLNWSEEADAEPQTIVDPEIDGTVAELRGIFPNPVRTVTRIGVYSPAAREATLRLIDPRGRVVLTRNLTLTQGEQWIRMSIDQLPQGVYGLVIELPEFLLSGKIIRQ